MIRNIFLVVSLLLVSLGLPVLGVAQPSSNNDKTRYSYSKEEVSTAEKAQLWGISPDDYVRYLEIMEGPLKHWNPNIDPVLALGIYARTEGERGRYAEIYALQEYLLTENTQAFERAYHEAFNSLFPTSKIIQSELMLPYFEHQSRKGKTLHPDIASNTLLDGDRILYFAGDACDQCQSDVAKLQSLVRKNKALNVDVYLLDIEGEAEARQWARDHSVDISYVEHGRVTINIDAGVYDKVARSSDMETDFYLLRNGEVYAVSRKGIFTQ